MRATVEQGRRRTGRASQRFQPGSTNVIVPVFDEGVARIRLRRERDSLGLYMGSPMQRESSYFLDGSVLRTVITADKTTHERTDMGAAAMPVRTQDVADFGRLEQAATVLVQQMTAFGPDNPPSAEQQEALVASYQGILAWRDKAQAQMARAEGQIDAVAVLLRSVLGA